MKEVAIACRYGHQSFFDLMGRDPIKKPMTSLELALFTSCIVELYNAEVKQPDVVQVED